MGNWALADDNFAHYLVFRLRQVSVCICKKSHIQKKKEFKILSRVQLKAWLYISHVVTGDQVTRLPFVVVQLSNALVNHSQT